MTLIYAIKWKYSHMYSFLFCHCHILVQKKRHKCTDNTQWNHNIWRWSTSTRGSCFSSEYVCGDGLPMIFISLCLFLWFLAALCRLLLVRPCNDLLAISFFRWTWVCKWTARMRNIRLNISLHMHLSLTLNKCFWILGSPSLPFGNCSRICHVHGGGPALHIYGPDIWDNNTMYQYEMVSFPGCSSRNGERIRTLIDSSVIWTGILMYLDWRIPLHILSMESSYFVFGW